MTRPPRGDALNAADHAPDPAWCRDRQGSAGLHHLQRRWAIGRIYETRGGPDHLALVLVVHHHLSDDTLRQGGDLEEAKVQFRKSWDAWKAWVELREDT